MIIVQLSSIHRFNLGEEERKELWPSGGGSFRQLINRFTKYLSLFWVVLIFLSTLLPYLCC